MTVNADCWSGQAFLIEDAESVDRSCFEESGHAALCDGCLRYGWRSVARCKGARGPCYKSGDLPVNEQREDDKKGTHHCCHNMLWKLAMHGR